MSAPNLPPEWVEIRYREIVPVRPGSSQVDSVETWKPFRVMSAADWDRGILVVCDDAGQSKQIKLDANHRMADRITASAPAPAQIQSRSYTMSAKHTPGPWVFDTSNDGESVKASNGNYIIEDVYHADYVSGSTADRRLIAAAPELLEALQDMVDYYGTASADVEALTKARAAIAKATGQDAQA